MFSLAWNIRKLEHLNAKGRSLRVELSALLDKLKDSSFDRKYLPGKLDGVKNAAEEFVKGVTRWQLG